MYSWNVLTSCRRVGRLNTWFAGRFLQVPNRVQEAANLSLQPCAADQKHLVIIMFMKGPKFRYGFTCWPHYKTIVGSMSSILQGRDIEMHPETNGPKIWYPYIYSLEGHLELSIIETYISSISEPGSKCFWYKWTWIHYLGLRHATTMCFQFSMLNTNSCPYGCHLKGRAIMWLSPLVYNCLCRVQLRSTLSSCSWQDQVQVRFHLLIALQFCWLTLRISLQGRGTVMHPQTNGLKVWYPYIHTF
jgi:hypothetical protein